jgi:hypothetical protein
MNKEDKKRLSELYAQRQLIGHKHMYYAFRNIPTVCRNHLARSVVAVVLISVAFLGAYLFINNAMSPEELDQSKEIPIFMATLVCCLLFLFGQSASFVEEWTRSQELGEAHEQLGREIKELMKHNIRVDHSSEVQ